MSKRKAEYSLTPPTTRRRSVSDDIAADDLFHIAAPYHHESYEDEHKIEDSPQMVGRGHLDNFLLDDSEDNMEEGEVVVDEARGSENEKVRALNDKLKEARRQCRELRKKIRDGEKKRENVKHGCVCVICTNPAQILTMYPCRLHGGCFTCIAKHVESKCSFQEDFSIDFGGYLTFAAKCPVCNFDKVVTDTMEEVIPPPKDLREFHYSVLRKPMTSCAYCHKAVDPDVNDDHVRHCPERKHACPRVDCKVKCYRPSLGYQHHLEKECTGFKCFYCGQSGLTRIEERKHHTMHTQVINVSKQLNSKVIEFYALNDMRARHMNLEHIRTLSNLIQCLNGILC
jgi:hypothetical protein